MTTPIGTRTALYFIMLAISIIAAATAVLVGRKLADRWGGWYATLSAIAGYLLVDGIAGGLLAFRMRPKDGWVWILFSAAMSVLLAILLFSGWPLSGIWAVGTLVGINLLFAGFSMISIGSAVRRRVQK